MERNLVRLIILALVAVAIGSGAYAVNAVTDSCARHSYSAPPTYAVDAGHLYQANIRTSRGTIDVELLPQQAPITVGNFVYLSQQCFYNGLNFHRVEDWVIQGGDPTGTGRGGPGYVFKDEISKWPFVQDTVAMANSGPNTNGSQFFILKKNYPLPPKYTVFGTVNFGDDVVQRIEKGDVIESITIQDLGPTPAPTPPAPTQ